MKSAGLKLYVLPWFSFPSSTEIASSFFRGADLQVRTTCWPATRLQTSVPAWTGGTTANAVPRISCIFKPADFLHVRAAVHRSALYGPNIAISGTINPFNCAVWLNGRRGTVHVNGSWTVDRVPVM